MIKTRKIGIFLISILLLLSSIFYLYKEPASISTAGSVIRYINKPYIELKQKAIESSKTLKTTTYGSKVSKIASNSSGWSKIKYTDGKIKLGHFA